jgi:hypothetical protein
MTTHVPIEERVARLAAKLNPDEAASLLRSWRYHKAMHTDAELEKMYAEHASYYRDVAAGRIQ